MSFLSQTISEGWCALCFQPRPSMPRQCCELTPQKNYGTNPLSFFLFHNICATQCARGVLDPPVSAFSLSLYRHPFLYTLCQYSGDIELGGYLQNVVGTVTLVMDLRITHEHWESSTDPTLHGHLHYPHDFDKPLNETVSDKIRNNHSDYNQNPLILFLLCQILWALPGDYIVNLYEFYSYKLIGKLTVFLQLQESILCNIIVEVSTTVVWHSPVWLKQKRSVF